MTRKQCECERVCVCAVVLMPKFMLKESCNDNTTEHNYMHTYIHTYLFYAWQSSASVYKEFWLLLFSLRQIPFSNSFFHFVGSFPCPSLSLSLSLSLYQWNIIFNVIVVVLTQQISCALAVALIIVCLFASAFFPVPATAPFLRDFSTKIYFFLFVFISVYILARELAGMLIKQPHLM